jgi:hypothetical protein
MVLSPKKVWMIKIISRKRRVENVQPEKKEKKRAHIEKRTFLGVFFDEKGTYPLPDIRSKQ